MIRKTPSTIESSTNLPKVSAIVLIVLVLTQIGTTGDNSVLSVATSALINGLDANISQISLANTIYSLCAGAFMIVGGLLGIIIGWKLNFRIGLLLAIAGEIIVAISPNMVIFSWVGRVLVGIGASLMIPSVLGIIPALYQGKDRVVAFGAIGAATGIASIIAPIAAGFLIDTFGWRISFVALAGYFILIFLGTFTIPNLPKNKIKIHFDLKGSILAVIGLFAVIIGLSKISDWGLFTALPGAPFTLGDYSPAPLFIIIGLIVLYILLKVENKEETKYGTVLIPKSFIKNKSAFAGILASAMTFLAFAAIVIVINPYFLEVADYNAAQTGMAMASLGIAMVIFSMGIPKLYPNINRRLTVQIGYLLIIISTLPMAYGFTPNGVNYLLFIGLAILGSGLGIVASQASIIVAEAVNNKDAQQSGGIQAASRNVGQAIGVALLGTYLTFSNPFMVAEHAKTDPKLSSASIEFVTKNRITFMSNANLTKLLQEHNLSDTEINDLLAINANARLENARNALYILAGITLLFLIFGTRHINRHKEDEISTQSLDQKNMKTT